MTAPACRSSQVCMYWLTHCTCCSNGISPCSAVQEWSVSPDRCIEFVNGIDSDLPQGPEVRLDLPGGRTSFPVFPCFQGAQQMSLKSLADDAVDKINKALKGPLTESEAATISKIVQDTLVKAVNESTKSCTTAAVICCGPEADLAHKISEDVERARYALLANLISMR